MVIEGGRGFNNAIAIIAFASAPPIPKIYRRNAIGIEIAMEIASRK